MSFLAFHDIITDHFVRKYINENNEIVNKQIEPKVPSFYTKDYVGTCTSIIS